MSDQAKLLLAIAALGLVDAVVPGLPILALVLAYVVINKPAWFTDMYERVYNRSRAD